jgi:G:T-mismatch repair DNA endonuclease (very short patch repair protein)
MMVSTDAQNVAQLRAMGLRVFIIWECQTNDPSELKSLLERFFEQLGPGKSWASMSTGRSTTWSRNAPNKTNASTSLSLR